MFASVHRDKQIQIIKIKEAGLVDVWADITLSPDRPIPAAKKQMRAFADNLVNLLNQEANGDFAPSAEEPSFVQYTFLHQERDGITHAGETAFAGQYDGQDKSKTKFNLTEVSIFEEGEVYKPLCQICADRSTAKACQETEKIMAAFNKMNDLAASQIRQIIAPFKNPAQSPK